MDFFLFLLWLSFGVGIVVQGIYLLLIFGRTAWSPLPSKSAPDLSGEEGVTVIIVARNKAKYLKTLISKLFEQDYPQYEVVMVNDRSTDRTNLLLAELTAAYPRLRIVTVKYTPKHVTAKKFALTLGIKAANNDVILLTEADCIPMSDQWIRKMTSPVRKEEKKFSIGYSGYHSKPGILNFWVRFETLLTALFYFSFTLWKAPFMGVGKNLCCRKSFFMNVKAFNGLWHIELGDGNLFVNRHATGKNSTVVIDPESITISDPRQSWSDYLAYKKEYRQTRRYFRTKDLPKTSLFEFSHAFFWFGGIGLLIYLGTEQKWQEFLVILGIILLRSTILLSVFHAASKKIQGTASYISVLVNDLASLACFWILPLLSYRAKQTKWK